MWVKFSCFRGQEISSTNTRCNAAHSVGSMRCSNPLACKLTPFISGRMSQFSMSLKTFIEPGSDATWTKIISPGSDGILLHNLQSHPVSTPCWSCDFNPLLELQSHALGQEVSATRVNCRRTNRRRSKRHIYRVIFADLGRRVFFNFYRPNFVTSSPFSRRPPVSFLFHNYCIKNVCRAAVMRRGGV